MSLVVHELFKNLIETLSQLDHILNVAKIFWSAARFPVVLFATNLGVNIKFSHPIAFVPVFVMKVQLFILISILSKLHVDHIITGDFISLLYQKNISFDHTSTQLKLHVSNRIAHVHSIYHLLINADINSDNDHVEGSVT